jgi:hypothetical protein
MSKIRPKKWVDVYPAGTFEGDEEAKFFKSLVRHPKYDWRSVAALSKESGLTKERVEKIIKKYFDMKMVFQNPKNEDHWGYWERVPHMLPDNKRSIAEEDKKNRISRLIGGS